MTRAQADLVLTGGKIHTPGHPSGFAQALAARDGVIEAVGADEEIAALRGPGTRVVDLRGRLALPAFGDAHVHAVSGGLESLRCDLTGLRTRQDYLATVAAYSERLAPGGWVLGGGWAMEAFPGGRLLPGMRADVAVLDQDLYSIPARDIGATSVAITVAGGAVVFGDE